MDAIFLKIVNMSIAASWLILAVILLRMVLKKAPKWINVLLWALVAVRLIFPVSFESSLSLIPNVEPISQEIVNNIIPEYEFETFTDAEANCFAQEQHQAGDVLVMVSHSLDGVYVAAFVWAVGIFALVVFVAISYFRLKRKVKVSLFLRDNIWICDDIQTPFILGAIKPRIYIPSGTDEAQLPHIIAHENAHLKRRDHWWKPLGFLVLAIHWFNPLVWVAYILLCRDIELACDEKVIRDLNQSESVSYSEALLSCSVNRRMVMVCPLAFGEVGVKERVKRVLNYKKPAFWIIVVAVIASVIMAVCFLTNPKQDSFEIRITIPAGTTREMIYQEDFVYSDEEISPLGNKITISSGDGLGDTEVVLKPIEVTEENAYEPTYLTPGMPVEMDVEKGAWFKIGISMQNPTEEDIVVYVEVDGIEVRIEDEVNSVLKWFDYTENPSSMDDEATIKIPIYQDITFSYNQEQIIASRPFDDSKHTGQTILIAGMPIWSAYFTDLTGDDYPEICATYSYGSGIIDNRVVIYDYVNGASYELSDRGYHDFTLRQDNQDGHLYVDKKLYNSDELVETGRLVFKDNCIQVEGFSNEAASIFQAEILEIHDGYYLVEPVEGSWELSSADRIEVPIKMLDPSLEPEVGDVIEIEYSGEILETYPARIADVYGIRVVEESEQWDLIPMVMVDGTLYLDTGHESTVEARCGVMDGEITSQVDGSKKPTVDDQSNFGVGYGYQYGPTEGTIEIYMNEQWRVFATEEVRQEIQFPTETKDSDINTSDGWPVNEWTEGIPEPTNGNVAWATQQGELYAITIENLAETDFIDWLGFFEEAGFTKILSATEPVNQEYTSYNYVYSNDEKGVTVSFAKDTLVLSISFQTN